MTLAAEHDPANASSRPKLSSSAPSGGTSFWVPRSYESFPP